MSRIYRRLDELIVARLSMSPADIAGINATPEIREELARLGADTMRYAPFILGPRLQKLRRACRIEFAGGRWSVLGATEQLEKKRAGEALRQALASNSVLVDELARVVAERDELQREVDRARADERHAMYWLSTVRDEINPGLAFDQLQAAIKALRAAALAVVERWETPGWKFAEPTATVIYALRDVIEAGKPLPAEVLRAERTGGSAQAGAPTQTPATNAP